MSSGREVEIKLKVETPEAGRRLIGRLGLPISAGRVFEANTIYDTPELSFRNRGVLVRVRAAGSTALLTFKGPAEPGRHKSREELEVAVSDAGVAGSILERLGLKPVFRYEKYRTEFRLPGSKGVVTLDETPIGVFLELEGEPGWIDRTAQSLGFAETGYITASYARLYFEHCEKTGVEASNMVFPPGPNHNRNST